MKRAQVRKVIEFQTALAMREFEEGRDAIYAELAAVGALQSGTTIRRVIRLMEELSAKLVSESALKVAAVSHEPDSFSAIADGVTAFWKHLEVELQLTCKMAGGRGPMHKSDESIARAAEQLFKKSQSIVESKLDLLRFTVALPVHPATQKIDETPLPTRPAAPLSKGGRPLAEHWDDMWAAIAVALYEGDLQPKTQADIEKAMHVWIDEQGLEAASSTVRQRARRLWHRIGQDN